MISYTTEKIFKNILISDPRPVLRGTTLLCPQKQCLSGKEDGLSGRTNQRLTPGGSSRRSRVRESALQERHCLFQSNAGSFRHAIACHRLAAARSRSGSDTTLWCHSLPLRRFATSRRKAILSPDSTPKRCNTLYLAEQDV